jgi:hypothetical protein
MVSSSPYLPPPPHAAKLQITFETSIIYSYSHTTSLLWNYAVDYAAMSRNVVYICNEDSLRLKLPVPLRTCGPRGIVKEAHHSTLSRIKIFSPKSHHELFYLLNGIHIHYPPPTLFIIDGMMEWIGRGKMVDLSRAISTAINLLTVTYNGDDATTSAFTSESHTAITNTVVISDSYRSSSEANIYKRTFKGKEMFMVKPGANTTATTTECESDGTLYDVFPFLEGQDGNVLKDRAAMSFRIYPDCFQVTKIDPFDL